MLQDRACLLGKHFLNMKTLCKYKEITDMLLLVLMLIKEITIYLNIR
jgi:hypothetical protein